MSWCEIFSILGKSKYCRKKVKVAYILNMSRYLSLELSKQMQYTNKGLRVKYRIQPSAVPLCSMCVR